jgi:hypothetical protein
MNNELQIKNMVENGIAISKIAIRLNMPKKDVKDIVDKNKYSLKKENFSEDKIEYICKLYEDGASAKQLGFKYSIDKRRIQKWTKITGKLRNKNDSHRFTEFNQNLFDIIDDATKAYWLGFFYADAYNCNTTNTFSVTLSDTDYDHLVKLSNFIGLPESKINRYLSNLNEKKYPTCSIRLYSKHICQKMTELGCPQAKSFIIKYPEWLPKELTIHFIRGMFDGDGSLCRRENGEWKWSLATTKECGESIQQIILDELKIIVNLRHISKTNNNTYELESNGNEKVLKLSEWLYNDTTELIRLNRKYQKYLELIDQQNNRSFQRNKYKISEEDKISIINDLSNGEKTGHISNKYKLHSRTITKMKHDDIYLYDKIACVNNQPITAKYVKTLDYDERMALVEPLFNHFRNQGWLYPDDSTKLNNSWKKLCNFNPDLSTNEIFNNGSLATDVCKYFCHNFYEATEVGGLTMKEVFNNDDKLRYLIKNRLGFDWWDNDDNDETFNISFRMLIQGMRSSRLIPSVSIFKPAVSKYMCLKYSNENDVIFDYSVGWGGRMLGAASCNRRYIGVDPLTTIEVQKMADFFDLKNITLIENGSEHVKLEENSIDFSYSSPPYFSQEYYNSSKTQAYNNGEDYFYNVYWNNTLDNIKHMLKPGKWFGLNVKNFPKMVDMAKDKFGPIIEEVKLRTIRNHLSKSAGVTKFESIYMFKNVK